MGTVSCQPDSSTMPGRANSSTIAGRERTPSAAPRHPGRRLVTLALLGLSSGWWLQACTQSTFAPEPAVLEGGHGDEAAGLQAELAATGTIYHVSTKGSDSNPGTQAKPFRTVQKAVNVARSGNTILIHGGTYTGRVVIKSRSNPAASPVVIQPAGDGAVTLKADLRARSCSERTPASDRTIQIIGGSDYWTIRNLKIVGGVYISGVGRVTASDVSNRRLPGRSSYDPAAAKKIYSALGVDPAYGIALRSNTILGRGIHSVLGAYGFITGNEIAYVDCGIGAAVWINSFSNGWTIKDNYAHDMDESDWHWMNESFRLGRGSSYNIVQGNRSDNLPGKGRGFATDVHAGWNTFRGNRATRTFVGFNEQLAGWGNVWEYNVSEANRRGGYQVYLQGGADTSPNAETPAYVKMRCNISRNESLGLLIGGVARSRFDGNGFRSVELSSNLKKYWKSAGNTWNGSSALPASSQPSSTASSC